MLSERPSPRAGFRVLLTGLLLMLASPLPALQPEEVYDIQRVGILDLSPDTVKTYSKRIYVKLDVTDRVGAVVKALRLDPGPKQVTLLGERLEAVFWKKELFTFNRCEGFLKNLIHVFNQD